MASLLKPNWKDYGGRGGGGAAYGMSPIQSVFRDLDRQVYSTFFVDLAQEEPEPPMHHMDLKPRHVRPICQKGIGITNQVADTLKEAKAFHQAADLLREKRIIGVAVNGYGQIIISVEPNKDLNVDELEPRYEDPGVPVAIASVGRSIGSVFAKQFESAGQRLMSVASVSLSRYLRPDDQPVNEDNGDRAQVAPADRN